MRENRVKRALANGGTALGTMVMEFSTTGIARLAAAAGADFVLFDMEHTGWGVDTVRTLLAAARPADVVPLVRVPAAQYHFVARVLDLGAMGAMVPMVESAEQARSLVQFAKYPPRGRRGCAFGFAHDDYAGGDVPAKMAAANEHGLLIALIETAAGLEDVENIAAVDGIDVLWVGHYDLTASLGIPGRFGHARYLDAVRRILEACRRHGKTPGFMASSVEEGRAYLAQGFRCLAYWGDLWIYQQGLRQGLEALRAALPPQA
jgi:2-dehydro-3-deoxyglucarate aldolase/4-hydroxy-2-oxoheptanedioate aldolase